MRSKTLLLTALWMFVGFTGLAAQEDRAVVQLRDGAKIEGRIEELDKGTLFVRVSLHDQRRIPVSQIALIDRVGSAAGLPETELREARTSDHLLLLQGGSSQRGQLVQIVGGEGSGTAGPRIYVFRTSDGQQRNFGADQVARIYLGSYPFGATTTTQVGALGATSNLPSGAIRVPATAGWVSTGFRVRRGDIVTFSASGEVQLSDNSQDRSGVAGRRARGAPSRTSGSSSGAGSSRRSR